MSELLRIAFLPLTDVAVLAVARERGFAEEEGIALDLVRTTSWATLRDRLVYGQVQGAQMLAPLAVAHQTVLQRNNRLCPHCNRHQDQ